MLDQGRKSLRGRRKLPYEQHTDPLVQKVLRLTDYHKDYVILSDAGISSSYLANLRAHHIRDPGIRKIQRILSAMGFELTIQPKNERNTR